MPKISWREALKAENCFEINKMLEDKMLKDILPPHLLYDGLEEVVQPSLKPEAVSVWKGRTALHVAARRGDAELVKRICDIVCTSINNTDYSEQYGFSMFKVIDDDYELDALAMAVVNGNKRIVNLLKCIGLYYENNPYDCRTLVAEFDVVPDEDERSKATLSKITTEALSLFDKIMAEGHWHQLYEADCDFNFLPIDLFFFHFSFSTWLQDSHTQALIRPIQQEIFSRAQRENLLKYLLEELKDGQGRTALHVAVDSQKVSEFLALLPSNSDGSERELDFLNAVDSGGRTPLYRAAAKGLVSAVQGLLRDSRTRVDLEITTRYDDWTAGIVDIDTLSWRNGFKSDCVYVPEEKLRRQGLSLESLDTISSTALHVAIIHKHRDVVDMILKRLEESRPQTRHPNCRRRCNWPVKGVWEDANMPLPSPYLVSTIELAILVGSIPILQKLLMVEADQPGYFTGNLEHCRPSFLLAAASEHAAVITTLLESKGNLRHLVMDQFNNTALHYALKGNHAPFHLHLVDFVGAHHVRYRRGKDILIPHVRLERDGIMDENEENIYSRRKGPISVLLAAGVDVWAKNNDGSAARPKRDAPKGFVTWWYDKLEMLAKEDEAIVRDAANAISVTATLVATASYLGPFQPPRGYIGDSVQVDVLAVRIFVVCNNLSFYFALAAIMLALLPSLSFRKDLHRTRLLVAFAVTFLFPSIVCVLLAFAAGYIGVIPDNGLSHRHLIVVATIVGGVSCIGVIIYFLDGLVKFLQPIEFRKEMSKFFRASIFMRYFNAIIQTGRKAM